MKLLRRNLANCLVVIAPRLGLASQPGVFVGFITSNVYIYYTHNKSAVKGFFCT